MKAYLHKFRSRRFGYSGWALRHREGGTPLAWTVSTNREEARELLRECKAEGCLLEFKIVKVRIIVEEIAS